MFKIITTHKASYPLNNIVILKMGMHTVLVRISVRLVPI